MAVPANAITKTDNGTKSCVIVTGAIAPYTDRLYGAFARQQDIDLHVLTCAKIEPQRHWDLPRPNDYTLKTLPGLRFHKSYTSHIYFNPGIWLELTRLRPQWVLTSGFSPTMVMAAIYAFATRTPLGIITDGSVETDPGQRSWIHRLMRKLVIPGASFGVCASNSSVRLLEKYGLARGRGIVVPIVTPWNAPAQWPLFSERPYDLLFCGALNDHPKGALFFADVVTRCKTNLDTLKVRIVGDGPLRQELESRFKNTGIDVRFDGYLQADQLPEAYSSSKLMLFPSRGDAWGLVANEAIACGTPVIGSPHAVSSHELVARYNVGAVHILDADLWAKTATRILTSPDSWARYQHNMSEAAQSFNLPHAVSAMRRALLAGLPGADAASKNLCQT